MLQKWILQEVSDAEKKQLLFDFNSTDVGKAGEFPVDKTIPGLFAEQVEKMPDRIAVVGADLRVCPNCVTYHQLNTQSDRLAGLLIEKGARADGIIGIMMERSVDMIIGLLGILKTGSAYLPLNPNNPQERVEYMLADSNTKILIINKSEARSTKFESPRRGHPIKNINDPNPNDQNKNQHFGAAFVLNFEHLDLNSLKGCPRRGLSNFDIRASNFIPSNLAYIIYTSGSTGRPKGVMVQHDNVVRLVINPVFIEAKAGPRLLMTGNFTFDIVTFETWWPLLNGLSLYLAGKNTVIRNPCGARVRAGRKIEIVDRR